MCVDVCVCLCAVCMYICDVCVCMHKCAFCWFLVLVSTEFGVPLVSVMSLLKKKVFAIFRRILKAPREPSRVSTGPQLVRYGDA